MNFDAWAPTMDVIRKEFGYSEEADRHAAFALLGLLTEDAWPRIQVAKKDCIVVAAGPSLGNLDALPDCDVLISCDGATTRLHELGIVPDLVVTDLDGEPGALRWAADEGAILVPLAHGDNLDALPFLRGRAFAGMHQVTPEPALEPLCNLGGFTDGDRAVLMLEALHAASCRLLAFEPDAPPGPYSHTYGATKPAKLAWAKRIVEACQARGQLDVTWDAQRT